MTAESPFSFEKISRSHICQKLITGILGAGAVISVSCGDRSAGLPAPDQPAAEASGASEGPASDVTQSAASQTGVPRTDTGAERADSGGPTPAALTREDERQSPPGPREPATVVEAAQVLDLRDFPLMEGAEEPSTRTVANLSYRVAGEVRSIFEFVRQKLLEQGWKELPNSYVSDESASGSFGRGGFTLTTSVSQVAAPGGEQSIFVSLMNLGNLDLAQLPTPPGAELQYSFPAIASFAVAGSIEETAAAVRELLLAAGWSPYGTAGDSQFFKQNAVRLSARVAAAPAQGGRTVIDYSAQQMSADLPAPPDAVSVQYSDNLTQLSFDSPGTMEDVDLFLRQELGQRGWEPTTEKPVQMDFRHFVIFRNAEKDLIEVTFTSVDDKTRVLARRQSAADVAEQERRAKEEADRRLREANQPKPKVSISLPAGATGVEASPSRIEFTVPLGQGRPAVDAIRKQLTDAGWEESRATLEPMFGDVELTNNGRSISLSYIESGVLAPEVTISSFGVELEKVERE